MNMRIKVRVWLIENGLTQRQIAKEAGVSSATVAHVLNGRSPNKAVVKTLLKHGCPEKHLSKVKKTCRPVTKVKDATEVKKWMAENGIMVITVAKVAKVSRVSVSGFIHRSRRSDRISKAMLTLGFPADLFVTD